MHLPTPTSAPRSAARIRWTWMLTPALVLGTLLAAGTVTSQGVTAQASPGATVPVSPVVAGDLPLVPAAVTTSAYDVTRTRAARSSRAARARVTLPQWRRAPYSRMVSWRESNNNCRVVNWNGPWRGKWQMTDTLWRAYGGTRFAAHPEKASCARQDFVAYRVWIDNAWRPWGG